MNSRIGSSVGGEPEGTGDTVVVVGGLCVGHIGDRAAASHVKLVVSAHDRQGRTGEIRTMWTDHNVRPLSFESLGARTKA